MKDFTKLLPTTNTLSVAMAMGFICTVAFHTYIIHAQIWQAPLNGDKQHQRLRKFNFLEVTS